MFVPFSCTTMLPEDMGGIPEELLRLIWWLI